jgi:hypothetical protein
MFYTGVIEDVNDPMKIGRCRVRVFGIHTDDKNLIPVNDLPWAQTLQPVTSASISGIGNSPSGLLPGSWVMVTFYDSDKDKFLKWSFIDGQALGWAIKNNQIKYSKSGNFKNQLVHYVKLSELDRHNITYVSYE